MPRYLITGGAGFIGSNLAHALVERGESVRILDDFSTARPVNLAGIEHRVEVLRGDLRDPEAVARAVQRGYFRGETVRRLLDEHVTERGNWHYLLWTLLMLELWHRTYIDGDGALAGQRQAAAVAAH